MTTSAQEAEGGGFRVTWKRDTSQRWASEDNSP